MNIEEQKETRKARYSSPNEVIRSLSKKNDVRITNLHGEQVIQILNANARGRRNDLGNSSFGKIDYLINHSDQKFTKQIVDRFDSPKMSHKKR